VDSMKSVVILIPKSNTLSEKFSNHGICVRFFEIWVVYAFGFYEIVFDFEVRYFFLHARIPVVLYGIVGSSFDDFDHVSPVISHRLVEKVENPLIFLGPLSFLDLWI